MNKQYTYDSLFFRRDGIQMHPDEVCDALNDRAALEERVKALEGERQGIQDYWQAKGFAAEQQNDALRAALDKALERWRKCAYCESRLNIDSCVCGYQAALALGRDEQGPLAQSEPCPDCGAISPNKPWEHREGCSMPTRLAMESDAPEHSQAEPQAKEESPR